MSKVNVDEIQVGDLVEMTYSIGYKYGETVLGVVEKIGIDGVSAHWADTNMIQNTKLKSITGHWKVINFADGSYKCSKCGRTLYAKISYVKGVCVGCVKTEEEIKVDELKVYTGKETIEALLEGKVLNGANGYAYKYNHQSNEINVRKLEGGEWEFSAIPLNNLFRTRFTEVVTPKVGDWVKVYTYGKAYTGKVTRMEDSKMYADWEGQGDDLYLDSSTHSWEILSPEQVFEYKREQAFSKVGRKLNEFKPDDIVFVESIGKTALVTSKKNEDKVYLLVVNEIGKGYTAKPHQLTPIAFTELQVDFS